MSITYPPELLPSPAEGEDAEVVVVHPDTGKRTTVFSGTRDSGTPGEVGRAYEHGQELSYDEALKRAQERKASLPPSYAEQVQERKIAAQRAAKKKRELPPR